MAKIRSRYKEGRSTQEKKEGKKGGRLGRLTGKNRRRTFSEGGESPKGIRFLGYEVPAKT